jgi:rod shape determining protein RodA
MKVIPINFFRRTLEQIRDYFKNMNIILLVLTLLLIIIGLVGVYSATYSGQKIFFYKQLIWYGLGLILMVVFANINYNIFMGIANQLYYFFCVLLALVLVFGHTSLGAQRWLKLPGFNLQPSEFMKLVLSFTIIRFIAIHQKESFTIKNMFKMFGLIIVPMLLVLKQPDLGTAILMVPVTLLIFYMGNMPWKKLLAIILIGLVIIPAGYHFLKDYQKQRIMIFLNPRIDPMGAGYNVIQSQIAVGSGSGAGKGWLRGTQSQLNFIPIKHTDFIFAVIAEEFGFMGGFVIIALYLLLVMEGLNIVKLCRFLGGKMMASAITGIIFCQAVINIGMNIGLMPVTGITLPLLSYGGSSTLMVLMALGILQNIYREYMKAEG